MVLEPDVNMKDEDAATDWTWGSAKTRKQYDGVCATAPWQNDRTQKQWHVGSDRKPVKTQLNQALPGVIRIDTAERSRRWEWLRIEASAARLGRPRPSEERPTVRSKHRAGRHT